MSTLYGKPAKQKVAQGHLLLEQPLRLEDIPRRAVMNHAPRKNLAHKVGQIAGVVIISVVVLFIAFALVCSAIALWRWAA